MDICFCNSWKINASILGNGTEVILFLQQEAFLMFWFKREKHTPCFGSQALGLMTWKNHVLFGLVAHISFFIYVQNSYSKTLKHSVNQTQNWKLSGTLENKCFQTVCQSR